ncbi:MAG: tRNA lysidine(34) synthetase TilS [Desulfobacterales bacterium]|nr:tRNA lysidine(34) synthetase TilS [Desulfobacterales bacterium]
MTRFHQKENLRFFRTVENTITEHQLLENQDGVLVGLSGGADSVALLWCLCRLAAKFGLRIGAAHLNHDLRGRESAADADFSAAFASRLKIPCHIETINVSTYQKEHKLSLEEAGRKVRYDFLSKTAAAHDYTKIALGHHADDNAELVLMNFIRGSGAAGLSGIPVKRPAESAYALVSALTIIRPLIRLTKAEIFSFLSAHHLPWRTDHTNRDTAHLRNRIRHDLLPALKKHYNPNIVETLNRSAAIAESETGWMTETLRPVFEKIIVQAAPQRVCLSITQLARQPLPVARHVLRQAMLQVKGNLRKISFQHVASVMKLCLSHREQGVLDLPDQLRIEKSATQLTLYRSSTPLRKTPFQPRGQSVQNSSYQLEKPGTALLPDFGLSISAEIMAEGFKPDFSNTGHRMAFFDMNAIHFPLLIRQVRSGDAFRPLGAAGTQKLKKFFIDHKVPVWERTQCPILESADRIIWVTGHRIDDRVKVTNLTQRILKIELTLAESVNND